MRRPLYYGHHFELEYLNKEASIKDTFYGQFECVILPNKETSKLRTFTLGFTSRLITHVCVDLKDT